MIKQEKNQIKIGIILSYINIGIGNLIPIFYTPVMLVLLGQNEYGLFKLSNNITSYLTLISLGIGSAITRYLIKARIDQGKEAEEKMLGLFMIIFQIIAVASFVVGVFLTFNLDIWYSASLTSQELDKMKVLVFLMVCNTALSFSLSPYISIVNAHEKFIFLQLINIVLTCVGPLLNIVLLFMGYASIAMTAGSLALGILSRFLYLVYVRKSMKIKPRYSKTPIHLLKEILTFSFWIFVGNLVGQLYNSTDTLMIGALPALATAGVAVYNVGLTFNTMMFSLTTGFSNLLAPKVNCMVLGGSDGKDLTNLAIRVGRIQCQIMILVISGFIAFGQPFIYYYAGADYKDAYWVAVLMMVPNIIPLAQSVCSSIIVAQNKHKFRSLVFLGIAILNVIGTWILMQFMGIVGAALATGIALLLGQGVAMNWFYKNKANLEIGRFWKEIARTLYIPILLCVITLLVSQIVDFYNPILLITGIVIFTLLDLILNWFFILNEYEKNLFLGPLQKLISKKNDKDGNNI